MLYKLFALTLVFVGNYPLTFAHHQAKISQMAWLSATSVLIYGSLLGSGILAGRYLTKPGTDEWREAWAILPMAALQLVGMRLGALGPTTVSVWFNLVLSGELLAFLYLGSMRRVEGVFRLALYGCAVEILGRYFDTFWKLLPRSFAFLMGGVLLIGGGILMERQRKALFHKGSEG